MAHWVSTMRALATGRARPLRQAIRCAWLLGLALAAPLCLDAECCASIHSDCARRDLRTGCDACADTDEAGTLALHEFVRPAPPSSSLAPELSDRDGSVAHPPDSVAFARCSPSIHSAERPARERASPPLFILHASLLL